jgi:hypothetical protein
MTVEYPFSLAQLAQILSALENERRNPNTKRNAIKASSVWSLPTARVRRRGG